MRYLLILLLTIAATQANAQSRYDEIAKEAQAQTDSVFAGRVNELTAEHAAWIRGSKLAVHEMRILSIEGLKQIRKQCLWTLRFGQAREMKRKIIREQVAADIELSEMNETNFRKVASGETELDKIIDHLRKAEILYLNWLKENSDSRGGWRVYAATLKKLIADLYADSEEFDAGH